MTTERNYNTVWENRVDWPYWDGLSKGEIRIQRCDKCQAWTWPAEWRCGLCGSWDLHWEAVAGEGRVFAWERTHQAFAKRLADIVPFVTVVVELPHAGGRRLLGILHEPSASVKIGAAVTADIRPPSERSGNLPGLWWRLVNP